MLNGKLTSKQAFDRAGRPRGRHEYRLRTRSLIEKAIKLLARLAVSSSTQKWPSIRSLRPTRVLNANMYLSDHVNHSPISMSPTPLFWQAAPEPIHAVAAIRYC